MAYHLSFQEYLDLNEAGLLKKWQNRIMGRDEEGKSGLATAHAMRHKDDAAGVGSAASGFVGNAASLAGNVVSGNIVGAATSIWGMISEAIKGGSKAYKATKAAMYVMEVRKHMAELKKHLLDTEQLEAETADAIIDAVFEVDGEIFDDVSPGAWAEGTKRFAAGLAQGYDNISEKIFAAVMAQVIREWVEKMGGKVEGLKDTIARLRGEKKQKIDFLEEPEVKEAMAEFDPPRVEKGLEGDVKQPAAGTPRTINQLKDKLIKSLGWPRLPQNGDMGCAVYEGREYCKGPIKLNDEVVSQWELDKIARYGWDMWLNNLRIMGSIKTSPTSPCRYEEPSFGYDASGPKQLMQWDAARKCWLVNIDSD